MTRLKHPKKDIEKALKYAESKGWLINIGGSHAWGKMYCQNNDKECRCGEFCIVSIWSAPRSSFNHARQIRNVVNNCIFETSDDS